MTRIEAFKALFGSDPDTTATQEAIDFLGDSHKPTDDEVVALSSDTNVLDNATDFADKPETYANRMEPGAAKDLLLAYAGRIKVIKSGSSSEASTEAPSGSTDTTKSAVVTDPLADLGVGSPSHVADPDDEGSTRTETVVPPPPPKKPGSIVPLEWHEARKLTQWPPLREQLIEAARLARSSDEAVRGAAVTRLERLRGVVELYYSQGAQLRVMAVMARQLVTDLRDQLNLTDPPEFRARYDVF